MTERNVMLSPTKLKKYEKANALIDAGASQAQTCRDLGINAGTLSAWRKRNEAKVVTYASRPKRRAKTTHGKLSLVVGSPSDIAEVMRSLQ
jgi:transposase-like protein